MRLDQQNQDVDLRMLFLLHAMRDAEGFMQEARRIKGKQPISESIWQRICDMGKDLISEEALFARYDEKSDSNEPVSHDRRKHERRVKVRRSLADRREQDRRTTVTARLGPQRRLQQRRQHIRRQSDAIGV